MEKRMEFKGVRMRKWGKWVSEVRIPNSRARIWLGTYHTPQQAARAVDCAVYFLRGSKANFNFPECLSQFPRSSCLSLSPAEIQDLAAKFALQECPQQSEDGSALCGNRQCNPSSSTESNQNLQAEEGCPLLDLLLESSGELPALDDLDFSVLRDEQGQVFLPEV